jgi:cytochrome c oxidase assembly protein subunit 15
MLHRFAKLVAACTTLLILAGSFVTSTESGLSVPDWPTTYGWNMFTFPPSMWVGGIFYEHGHRLIASTVGLLTTILAVWLWLSDSRRWLKRLGVIALVAVIVQGILGGITVLYFLPWPISTAHAGLAEIFFCLTVAIALFTSQGWLEVRAAVDDGRLRRVTLGTTVLIYTQILVGAAMRHTDAGLAIPDFPLMFGGLVPDHWDARIAVHFVHRIGAIVVAGAAGVTAWRVWTGWRHLPALARPAVLLGSLTAVQLCLGAATVLSGRQFVINSFHVLVGALVLTTSLVLTLRVWQVTFPVTGRARVAGSAEVERRQIVDGAAPGVRA